MIQVYTDVNTYCKVLVNIAYPKSDADIRDLIKEKQTHLIFRIGDGRLY